MKVEINKIKTAILGIPTFIWFLLFICGPLCLVILTSILKRGAFGGVVFEPSVESYVRAFDLIYLQIFFRSFCLSFLTSFICLILAIPIAWTISTQSAKIRTILIFLIAIPFLMNLIVRIYAIRLFMGYDGPLVSALQYFQIEHDPFSFSQNIYLVFYGMVTTYLPFMIFPIYGAFEKFDFSLIEANMDLGGNSRTGLMKIIIPELKPSIASGLLLVFIPALGEFVIPDLLGGAKSMLLGNLITEQFLKSRDWPFGSSLTVLMISSLMFFVILIRRWGSSSIKGNSNREAAL